MGPLAEDVLLATLQDLISASPHSGVSALLESSDPREAFNASVMVFLPKAPTSLSPNGLGIYAPGDTRPLNIVDCDNRIL